MWWNVHTSDDTSIIYSSWRKLWLVRNICRENFFHINALNSWLLYSHHIAGWSDMGTCICISIIYNYVYGFKIIVQLNSLNINLYYIYIAIQFVVVVFVVALYSIRKKVRGKKYKNPLVGAAQLIERVWYQFTLPHNV